VIPFWDFPFHACACVRMCTCVRVKFIYHPLLECFSSRLCARYCPLCACGAKIARCGSMELFKCKSTRSGRSTRNMYDMAKQLNVRGVKAFLFPMAPSSCWSRLRCSMMLTRFGLYGDRYMRRLHQDLLVSEQALMVGVAFRAPFDCPTGSITSTTSYSSIQTASVSKSCSFVMLPATYTSFEAYH
jgi:hypothetical protein